MLLVRLPKLATAFHEGPWRHLQQRSVELHHNGQFSEREMKSGMAERMIAQCKVLKKRLAERTGLYQKIIVSRQHVWAGSEAVQEALHRNGVNCIVDCFVA